jgi:hypothetical protein
MQDLLKRIDQTTGIWIGRGLCKAEGRKRGAGTDKQDTTVTESKTNQQSCHPCIRVVMLKHEHARNQDRKDLCLTPESILSFTRLEHRFEHGNIGFLGALARLLVEGQTTASAEEHLQKLIDVARLENRIVSALPPSHWRDVIIFRRSAPTMGGRFWVEMNNIGPDRHFCAKILQGDRKGSLMVDDSRRIHVPPPRTPAARSATM